IWRSTRNPVTATATPTTAASVAHSAPRPVRSSVPVASASPAARPAVRWIVSSTGGAPHAPGCRAPGYRRDGSVSSATGASPACPTAVVGTVPDVPAGAPWLHAAGGYGACAGPAPGAGAGPGHGVAGCAGCRGVVGCLGRGGAEVPAAAPAPDGSIETT